MLTETISNPGMVLTDIPALAHLLHNRGILLCVDNTFATPVFCRPIEHGADLVIHSVGKFLGGHHDLTAGVVAGRHDLIAEIRRSAYLLGPTLAPMDAWLAVRGIKTLVPRMTWINSNACQIATYLETHPAVAAVRYPGHPSPNRRALTHRLLPNGQGGLLAFDLSGGELAADRFIRNLTAIPYAPTVGGPETIVSYPPQSDENDAGDNASTTPFRYRNATLRLSIGLEDPADLIADLRQALDRLMPNETTTHLSIDNHMEVHA